MNQERKTFISATANLALSAVGMAIDDLIELGYSPFQVSRLHQAFESIEFQPPHLVNSRHGLGSAIFRSDSTLSHLDVTVQDHYTFTNAILRVDQIPSPDDLEVFLLVEPPDHQQSLTLREATSSVVAHTLPLGGFVETVKSGLCHVLKIDHQPPVRIRRVNIEQSLEVWGRIKT